MFSDLKFAIRMLLRNRGFTTAALVVLTLGIGATTAMFSATNSVLLRPLPFPDPGRLVVVREARAQAGFAATVLAAPEYLHWTRDTPVLRDSTIVSTPGLAVVVDNGAPDRLPALSVSADFFPLFGVVPQLGRPFGREAETPGRGDVVVIGDRFWHERLGGAADVVGRTLRVEGRQTTIVGVLPAGFSFQGRIDLIVPMVFTPEVTANIGSHSYDVYARLAPGVTAAQAAGSLSRAALAQQTVNHLTGVTLVPLKDEIVGETAAPLLVMFGAVGFVLLIACANIANLLLARGQARQREIAIRAALGAGRGRVIRQLITESLLLSCAGGACGALLSTWLTDLLARGGANSLARADEIHTDGRSLLFALAISMAAGIIFGLAPAWHASRTDVNGTLKEEGRGSSGSRQRVLSAFVVAEIALALVLLVGAGLLLATFAHLRQVDPGFDTAHTLVVPAFLPDWKYPSADERRNFFIRATGDLAALPGVVAAGASNALPLSGDNTSGSLTIEGAPAPTPQTRANSDRRAITPGFFQAMGIRVLAGRPLTAADGPTAPPVLVVSRSFAEHFWPGQDAVGKRVKLGRYEERAPWSTVVGVVNDVQHDSLSRPPRPVLYYPHAQDPHNEMQIVVRSASGPGAIAGAVRDAIHRIDPDLPVAQMRPYTALLGDALTDSELALSLLGAFAIMALALSAAGIYGVMAFVVAERRVEFGIRLALGASAGDLVRLVCGHGLRLTMAGLALGLIGARLTSTLLRDMVVGVGATDPAVFAGTAVLLALIAMTASLVPAWRAMRVDPIDALKAR